MIRIIGSKKPFIIIVGTTLLLIIVPLLVSGLLFFPSCLLKSYDIYDYNCWHFAYDAYQHFDRLGFDVQLKTRPLHVWSEVNILGHWVRYEKGLPLFDEVEGETITLSQLEELIREGYHG